MTALGPKRAGFQPNPSWMTLGRNQIIFVEKMVLFSKKLDDILISRPTFAENIKIYMPNRCLCRKIFQAILLGLHILEFSKNSLYLPKKRIY